MRKLSMIAVMLVFTTAQTILLGPASLSAQAGAQSRCVDCHTEVTPGIVADWRESNHSKAGLDCAMCHGSDHTSTEDVAAAGIVTPQKCAMCHAERVKQFESGKHAFAWAAMNAMPTTHALPMALTEGMKGCGGCHKIGLKSEDDITKLRSRGVGFGMASCDACHTRHIFSTEEARQPQACQTCHMGFDHAQWEMYSASKHGVRYLLKQNKTLPETVAAPTCQTCHMQDGDHAVRTAWGFLAVRLPMPDDEQWAADRVTILQALGVLDPDGQPTGRLDVVKAADVARLTQQDWEQERGKMLRACGKCHSPKFARAELRRGDEIIRETDNLLADAIRTVADLYRDGILEKPENYAYAFPDLLTFHDAPTPIEQKLFVMHLEHRMRAFQGAFHANPDYALWYGWSEMTRDLSEIKAMAEELRRNH
ncbi:MAG: cytochrome C [Gemmatimonadales bacterium]|nr:cytochrome C [Gemmatimonadales bacterium]NIN12983.1 cytochrome C [Gemmatimonadales bacterium]NIN51060.1 cytochrome C [Gemmatimonadales bacterium]NIP08524.1 cytochrome C [Gemmatimonadales bacterium]NIR02242.1 cytochrome C [Gemmatimonadales bacterium]